MNQQDGRAADDKPVEVTGDNFEDFIKSGYSLVDFWADWCSPCHMIAPIIEDLAKEYQGKVKIGKVDTDAHPEIPAQFGIMGIPHLILFKDGVVVDRVPGAAPKQVYVQMLERHINE